MRILSISPAHDSSVCVLNNGELEFFCKEERISRIKRDKSPSLSLELCLSNIGGDVDHFVWATPSNDGPKNVLNEVKVKNGFADIWFGHHLRKKFRKNVDFITVGHHLSHAMLAFVNSEFEQALVFVIDRNGSIIFFNNEPALRESESVYVFDKAKGDKQIYKSFWKYKAEDSSKRLERQIQKELNDCDVVVNDCCGIVKVYEAATTLIGQRPLENGKTMGLSSYGEDISYDPLFEGDRPISELFEVLSNEHYAVSPVCFAELKDKITNEVRPDNFQFYANKAKQVQLETQEAALNLIKRYVKKTGINNVCLVGGYALNVVANNHYIKNLPNINFYFEPTSDDTGTSIGAAMAIHRSVTGEWAKPLKDNFYHYYEDKNLGIGKKATLQKVVDLLLKQKTVAIFEGSPEAGPRALGHRSILFDPRNKNAKEIVNRIKRREWYRPFAGVILEEFLCEYFEDIGIKSSPHMTINFDAKEHTKGLVPGIVHVDGTCRVQTVSSGTLHNLISLFYKKTGCPMVMNTSFNLAGQALIQTKEEAVEMLENSELDAVYFADEGRILIKS